MPSFNSPEQLQEHRRTVLRQAIQLAAKGDVPLNEIYEWANTNRYTPQEVAAMSSQEIDTLIESYIGGGCADYDALQASARNCGVPSDVLRTRLGFALLYKTQAGAISRTEIEELIYQVLGYSKQEFGAIFVQWKADFEKRHGISPFQQAQTPTRVQSPVTRIQSPEEAIVKAPSAAIAVQEPPQSTSIQPAPSLQARETKMVEDHARSMGELLAETMTSLGTACDFMRETNNPDSRIREYLFRQHKGVPVRKFEAHALDLFSVHGLPQPPVIRPTAGGFLVEVLKEHYTPPPLSRFMEDWYSALPTQIPSIKVGVDSYGQPVHIDFSRSPVVIVSGQSGSGKTSLAETFLLQATRSTPPSSLQVVVIDTQNVNFQHYKSLPHLWEGGGAPKNWSGNIVSTPEDIQSVFEELKVEQAVRQKKFLEYGVRSLDEYNQVAPTPLPFIVVLADEYRRVRSAVPEAEEYLIDGVEAFRKFGIYYMLLVHYIKGVIPPAMRVCQKIALHMSKEASAAFIDDPIAESLALGGDGFLVHGTLQQRFQVFSLGSRPGETRNFVEQSVGEIRQRYPKLTLSESNRAGGDWWLTESRYYKLLAYEADIRDRKLTQADLYRDVFGDLFDSPENAANGGNRQTNDSRIRRLKEKFGSRVAA